jgi:hypothetical protein
MGIFCALLLMQGCAPRGVTQLGGEFRSYQTASEARSKLQRVGVNDRWREEHKSLQRSDPRPFYEFLIMSGPFTLSGIEGDFKLIFFNDRLMSTEFSTHRGQEVIAALREHVATMPGKPREEIILDIRTRFRYDVDPDGTYRFSWRDAKLEDEWSKWVGSNS